jgi:hypothetical protein
VLREGLAQHQFGIIFKWLQKTDEFKELDYSLGQLQVHYTLTLSYTSLIRSLIHVSHTARAFP